MQLHSPAVVEMYTLKTLLAHGVLVLWAVLVLVGGAYLMADHWIVLPAPNNQDDKLQQALAANRNTDEQGQWLAVHVLYSKCTCSLRIIEHLFSQPRIPGIKEKILFIDAPKPEWLTQAQANGFSYQELTPQQLHTTYNVSAAPLLVVVDPESKLRYVGGYTLSKQSADVKDLAIIGTLLAQQVVVPIPLFGCAISKELQKLIDPWGLKYAFFRG